MPFKVSKSRQYMKKFIQTLNLCDSKYFFMENMLCFFTQMLSTMLRYVCFLSRLKKKHIFYLLSFIHNKQTFKFF